MSRESGGEQPQKTVAELLAQHGGQVGGTPRRRRRRAEDDSPDIGDTAPQAIIDRVQGDSAAPDAPARHNGRSRDEHEEPQSPRRRPRAMPPQEEAGPPTRRVMPPRRQAPPTPQQQPESYGRGPDPRHAPPQQPPQPPQQSQPLPHPPPQQSQPLPTQPPQPPQRGSLSPGPDASPEQEAPEAPSQQPQAPHQAPRGSQMGSGGYPVPQAEPPRMRRRPLRRPAPPPPEPEPHTEQFPAVAGETHETDEPPAGLSGWRRRRDKTQMDDTEVGVMPPVPGPAQDASGAGPPTGAFTPSFDTGDQPAVDDRNEHGDLNGYDGYDGYDDGPSFGAFDDDPLHEGGRRAGAVDELDGEARDAHGDSGEYGYEDEPLGDEAHDDTDDSDDRDTGGQSGPGPSPAKQWMTLGAQLALGAVGGAAVWLGFNWLWVKLPAAALVAALAVTVGLVLIVRKVRRAEDLQTTVLALLVGLVVTVSPAALLLVSQ